MKTTKNEPQKQIDCCICGNPIPIIGSWRDGHNAEPVVKGGRCCDDCNASVVLPARPKALSMLEILKAIDASDLPRA